MTSDIISKLFIVVATFVIFSSVPMFLLIIFCGDYTDMIATSGSRSVLLLTGHTFSTFDPVCMAIRIATVFTSSCGNILIFWSGVDEDI